MNKKESKSRQIKFRVTPTEEQKLMKWAEESGLEPPLYYRKVLMLGITFRIEANMPEEITVDSVTLEHDEAGEKQSRHGAG